MKQALRKIYPNRVDIILLMALAFGLLVYSYTRPFMQIDKFFFFSDEYSLVASIKGLWQESYYFLAFIIFCFSVVFPLLKLIAMFSIWFFSFSDEKRERLCYWLGVLGKWSMLDVFVIAILIVMVKAQALTDAKPKAGIYIFSIAIILSLVLSILLDKLIQRKKESAQQPDL